MDVEGFEPSTSRNPDYAKRARYHCAKRPWEEFP